MLDLSIRDADKDYLRVERLACARVRDGESIDDVVRDLRAANPKGALLDLVANRVKRAGFIKPGRIVYRNEHHARRGTEAGIVMHRTVTGGVIVYLSDWRRGDEVKEVAWEDFYLPSEYTPPAQGHGVLG